MKAIWNGSTVAESQVSKGAAWYYADPKAAALEIKGRIAFWRGVNVVA